MMIKYSELRYGYPNVILNHLPNRERHLLPLPFILKKCSIHFRDDGWPDYAEPVMDVNSLKKQVKVKVCIK